MKNGWIKLHYRLLEWEWRSDPNMVSLFIYLLLRANYKPVRKNGETFERGVILTSREELSRETGITERTIRTCLSRLKSTNEITINSTKQGSIITINNYDKYQSYDSSCDQPNDLPPAHVVTNERPTIDQQPTSSIEINNIKKEKIKNKFRVVEGAWGRNEFLEDFFGFERQGNIRQVCLNWHTDLATLQRLAREVLDEWEATSHPPHASLHLAQQHLLNQIRIKLTAENRQKQFNNAKTFNSAERRDARRREFEEHILRTLSEPDEPEFDPTKYY